MVAIGDEVIGQPPAEAAPLGRDGGRDSLATLPGQTTWQTILAACERVPDRDALVAADDAGQVRRLTYRSLVERIRNVSAGLASLGVRRGDRVVLWMTNTLEWVVCSFAIQRLGAAAVPINTFLKPVEIAYLIAQSGARHLVMIDSFRALLPPMMLAEICPEFSAATEPGFLASANLPDLRNVVVLNRGGGVYPGAFDLAALEALGASSLAARDLADRLERAVRPSDLAMVKFTSGSTGFPKGVMLEQGGVIANGRLHSRRTGAGADDVIFSMMPFFHGGGSIWGLTTAMVNGATLVFTEAFNAKVAAGLIPQERATIMFGVLAEEVAAAAVESGVNFPTLRIAPVPNDETRCVMPNVTYTIVPFGLTETYGPAAVAGPGDPPEARGSCGLPLDGNEIRVVDPQTGEDVDEGVVGEAWIRGLVMRGYWNKPEETARAFTSDGWFRSEDLVRMDAHGHVTYVGRLKLMLKVGGENVSIEEVENVVASHAAVKACAVVGTPDPRKGEAVGLYVVRRDTAALDAAGLRGWLSSRLARFKLPREIVFLDDLPWLANGKIDRVALKQRAEEEFGT